MNRKQQRYQTQEKLVITTMKPISEYLEEKDKVISKEEVYLELQVEAIVVIMM